MNTPSISVVIASYNRRGTVGRAIDSALAQSLAALEIIVVDDGSKDGTAPWIAETYPTVRLLALERNGGAAAARNEALRQARGDVVAFLDSDDWWDPAHLQTLSDAFGRDPGAVMAVSDVHMVLSYGDAPTSYVHPCRPDARYSDLVENLLLDNFITTMSCVAVRQSAIAAAGLLNESLRVVHDQEWYMRLSKQGGVVCTQQALVWRTIGDDNLVADLKPFLADQFRLLGSFFSTPLGRPYRHLQWRVRSHTFEGFAAMAKGRGQHGAAARHLFMAYAYTCRDLRPRPDLLRRTIAACIGAARVRASTALRKLR
jgi:glycosyltransferase involved in cell wall biosynthesis